MPFDTIRAEHVEPGLRAGIERAGATLDAVSSGSAPPTWATVFEPLEAATDALSVAASVVAHLESVRTTPELREAYNRTKPDLSAFFAAIPLDERLHGRLKALAQSEEAGRFRPDQARALERTLDEFRRHGAELGPEPKARLQAVARALATETAAFGQNVLDATAEWSMTIEDEGRLAGLPDTARAGARAAARDQGEAGYVLTLHAPSYLPAMTYLEDAGLRETLYRAQNGRATGGERDNEARIRAILELRREQAHLLGYRSFADLVLEPRMAKSAEVARGFVRDLESRVRPAFEAETAELRAARAEQGDGGPLRPWDVAFLAERIRKARFAFDDEALRPYFPLPTVVRGLFTIAERLYGVRIEPTDGLPRWHDEVQAFRVREDDRVLGEFYVDLHPRSDKRGGAWMHGLRSGVVDAGSLDRPHLGLFAANLTRGVDGAPALLTHDEVQTLFHEFGHLLHHLLSEVRIRSQAGTRVAWDFVELPSQIMENWCWNREALDLFARHHETGQALPDELFSAMLRARTFRAASAMMRQLGFAEVDLELHTDFDPEGSASPVEHARAVLERFSPAPYYEGWGFLNGFTHLFSGAVGYAAGYYSYKWAEVLDADAFERFEEEGVLSREVGRSFREAVLSRGDADSPEVAFERFRGRPPRLDALLRRAGLPT